MKLLEVSPFDLVKNEWNSNRVDRDNFEKLKKSLGELECFKPVIVRTLRDGRMQILGGFHRAEAAKELGWLTIPVLNLGEVSDQRAKEISLVDNTRYGKDDAELLAKLLEEMDTDLIEIIVPETEELSLPEADTDLDETPVKEERADEDHKTLRFRLDKDKAEEIEAVLHDCCKANDYKMTDGYNDFSQALYHLLILEGR